VVLKTHFIVTGRRKPRR